ncbi:MAG: hypothetical protein AAB368_03685, partial [bacterium]
MTKVLTAESSGSAKSWTKERQVGLNVGVFEDLTRAVDSVKARAPGCESFARIGRSATRSTGSAVEEDKTSERARNAVGTRLTYVEGRDGAVASGAARADGDRNGGQGYDRDELGALDGAAAATPTGRVDG